MRPGRVLSRSSPSTPASAKRSCQRQTQVFDLAVASMMPLVPMPSAVRRMIRARQTCFCGLLRSRTTASRRRRSSGETSMLMPVRMPQTRMAPPAGESLPGFFCQVLSTSSSVGGEIEGPRARNARPKSGEARRPTARTQARSCVCNAGAREDLFHPFTAEVLR